MNIKLHTTAKGKVAEIQVDSKLASVDDFLDVMGNANYQGAHKIILPSKNLPTGFLDLKTGLAGEILQKFSTYKQKLAIIGDFSTVKSQSLRDFIRESNRVGRILFVDSVERALEKL